MATATIGGKSYFIPEMNFLALERAWPFIQEVGFSLDPIKAPAAGVSIIAAGLMESEYFKLEDFDINEEDLTTTADRDADIHARVSHFLKKSLLAREMGDINKVLDTILEEAGLERAPVGELQLTQEQKEVLERLMETRQILSSSSSPPASKEEAGTVSIEDGVSSDTTQ